MDKQEYTHDVICPKTLKSLEVVASTKLLVAAILASCQLVFLNITCSHVIDDWNQLCELQQLCLHWYTTFSQWGSVPDGR